MKANALALCACSLSVACSSDDPAPTCGAPPTRLDPGQGQIPPCAEASPALVDAWAAYDPWLSEGWVDPLQGEWEPMPNLLAQSMWWANVRVNVLEAQAASLPDATRIDLLLELESHDPDEVDYTYRDTWDLVLASGERLRPHDTLGVRLATGDRARATLRYQTGPDANLEGAALELNGQDRGSVEPEHLPLDAPVALVHSHRIDDLAGSTIHSDEPGGDIAEIVDARWGKNGVTGRRAERGMRAFSVVLRLTARLHWLWTKDDSFRAVFDGNGVAPWQNTCSSKIDVDTTEECILSFDAPESPATGAFDITFDGDGGQHRAEFSLENLTPMSAP